MVVRVNADTTTVYGTVPSYANQKLQLSYISEPITGKTGILASTEADSTGKFVFTFDIQKVTYAFIEKGILHGDIFLVPGKDYQITLPKFRPKTKADLINPYFEPYEFYIKVLNEPPRGLNNAIPKFDNDFAHFLDRHFQLISLQGSRARFDTIFQYFYNKNNGVRSHFFKNYMAYSIKSL